MNKQLKNIRQGQTRWKVVVYEPGHIDGYDDQHIAAVHRCFVTSVSGNIVRYTVDDNGYMIAGREWFIRNTESSFRKALKKANLAIKKINNEIHRL